jgi:hypothetical protein
MQASRFNKIVLAILLILVALPLFAKEMLGGWDYDAARRTSERADHVTWIVSMEDDYGPYIAIGDRFGLVRILYLTGDGSEEIWSSKQLNGIVQQVISTDLDGDFKDELIAWTDAGMVYVWSAHTQRLKYESLMNDFDEITCMCIGDTDDDVAYEIIINADEKIHYLDGKSFSREYSSISNFNATRMACADVDGDNSNELVLNTGQVLDARSCEEEWSDQVFGARIELMDIDGDGLPEILTESDNSSLRIFDADYRKEKHLQ